MTIGNATAGTDTKPKALTPSALSGVRFLVSKRIEELEAGGDALDAELNAGIARRSRAQTRVQGLTAAWEHVLAELPHLHPDAVDASFREMAQARAELAASEEH
ncbi:MAG TPA: hypothetical protein VJU79_01940 [Candidatus Dormibacteraeota bacterium]|nr:hypothetical protein [Candidatus Dormibacteraeota bacterium]